jgi:hypothetical protein
MRTEEQATAYSFDNTRAAAALKAIEARIQGHAVDHELVLALASIHVSMQSDIGNR